MSNKVLMHYGVLGMKWGVRKEYFRKPHIVPKGTTIYRTSVKKVDVGKGPTYVTYLQPDRDLYRGQWAWAIRKNGGLDQNGKVYENQYQLKRNIKVAGRDDVKAAVEKVLNDEEELKSTAKSWLHMAIGRGRFGPNVSSISELSVNHGKEFVHKVMGDIKNADAIVRFDVTTGTFGVNKQTKGAVINELKKKGYDAMVDEASVGGRISPREGIAPMIVFDGESVLNRKTSTAVTPYTEARAGIKYAQWQTQINLKPKGEW